MITTNQETKASEILGSLIAFHTGKKRRIRAQDLIKEIGWNFKSASRKLRLLIADLRKQGHPICSNGGYYIPSTRQEAEQHISILKKHALSEFKVCNDIVRGLNARFGTPENQLELGFDIYEY